MSSGTRRHCLWPLPRHHSGSDGCCGGRLVIAWENIEYFYLFIYQKVLVFNTCNERYVGRTHGVGEFDRLLSFSRNAPSCLQCFTLKTAIAFLAFLRGCLTRRAHSRKVLNKFSSWIYQRCALANTVLFLVLHMDHLKSKAITCIFTGPINSMLTSFAEQLIAWLIIVLWVLLCSEFRG
jgi:hypothetical protein